MKTNTRNVLFIVLAVNLLSFPACRPDKAVESQENTPNVHRHNDTLTAHIVPFGLYNHRHNGALNGRFTINDNGDQIRFSQGNLIYIQSTDTYLFHSEQYKEIGNDNISDGHDTYWDYYEGTTLADSIDLFGWGTGNNPTLTSYNTQDYSTFTDWGTNPIANGGNQPNLWRTLSYHEWIYIFFKRKAPRYEAVEIEEEITEGRTYPKTYYGFVIYPDNWVKPQNVKWNKPVFDPDTDLPINGNICYPATQTVSEWKKMEKAGAVFLPTTDVRFTTTIADNFMEYITGIWTTTTSQDLQMDDNKIKVACVLSTNPFFPPEALWLQYKNVPEQRNGHTPRDWGLAVRLVQDIKQSDNH